MRLNKKPEAKKAEQEAAAESDGRIEKIRQLFIETVAETGAANETEQEAGITESPTDKPEGNPKVPPKKKERLPLSSQLPKIKRKRTKKDFFFSHSSCPGYAH